MFDSRHNLCFHSVPPPPRAPRLFEPRKGFMFLGVPECTHCGVEIDSDEFSHLHRMCFKCARENGPQASSPAQLLTPAPAVSGGPKVGDRVKVVGSHNSAGDTIWEEYIGREGVIIRSVTGVPDKKGRTTAWALDIASAIYFYEYDLELLPPAAAKPEEIDASKIEVGDWIKLREYTLAESFGNPPWDAQGFPGKAKIVSECLWVKVEHIGITGVIAKYCFPLCAITHHSKTKPEGAE